VKPSELPPDTETSVDALTETTTNQPLLHLGIDTISAGAQRFLGPKDHVFWLGQLQPRNSLSRCLCCVKPRQCWLGFSMLYEKTHDLSHADAQYSVVYHGGAYY
jgi:hypothetical protein